jgi:hypothetical protein
MRQLTEIVTMLKQRRMGLDGGEQEMKYLLICTLFSSNLALAQQPLGYPQGSYQQGYQQGSLPSSESGLPLPEA